MVRTLLLDPQYPFARARMRLRRRWEATLFCERGMVALSPRVVDGYHDWIIITIFFCSCSETNVGFRRCRFRLEDFDESIWLRNAFIRLNLPVPVLLNRFFAPESDFILGIRHFPLAALCGFWLYFR